MSNTRTRVLAATVGIGALALIGGLALRNDRPEPDGAREFRATRPAPTKHDGVRAVLRRVIERAGNGDATEPELVQTLLEMLNRDEIGDPRKREKAAKQTIAEVMEAAARLKSKPRGSSKLRQRALDQQAATLMRELHPTTRHGSKARPTFGPAPQGFARLRWDELTDITYEEGKPLPEQVRSLDGKRVAMAGYLVEGAYDELLLVKSVWGCCFGEPPAIDEAVVITMKGQVRDAWFASVVRIVGTLEVGPELEEGQLLSIYRLDAVQVDTLR